MDADADAEPRRLPRASVPGLVAVALSSLAFAGVALRSHYAPRGAETAALVAATDHVGMAPPDDGMKQSNEGFVAATDDPEPVADDDTYASYESFFKWTFTSGSPELVLENREAMWMALGFTKYDRATSLDTFMTVGPSGCSNASLAMGTEGSIEVARSWVSTPFKPDDPGGNEIHWVYDVSANNAASVDLPVHSWHEALTNARESSIDDQFSDQKQTYYAPWADEFIKSISFTTQKFGYHFELIRGSSDMPSKECFIIIWANHDGQIFELVAPRLKDASLASHFKKTDRCMFRPVAAFKRYDKILGNFKGTNDMGAHGQLDPAINPVLYSSPTDSAPTDADAASDDDADDKYLSTSYTIRSARQPLPGVMPMVTHIASTDPTGDVNFFAGTLNMSGAYTLDRGASEDEASAWAEFGEDATSCDVTSEWLRLNSTHSWEPHYMHLAYHENYKPITLNDGTTMNLQDYQKFIKNLRKDMAENVYDVYMDDHMGMNTWQSNPVFGNPGPKDLAKIALGLYKEGNAILTRREPNPGQPTLYQESSFEEYSIFFVMPASQQVFQVFSTGSEQFRLEKLGLPTFCDWNFCDLNGYRSKDETHFTEPQDCGFSMPGYRSPGKDLPKFH